MTPIEDTLSDPNNPDYAKLIQDTYGRAGSATEIANLAGMDYGTAQGILNNSLAQWNASHPAVDQSGIATLNSAAQNTGITQPSNIPKLETEVVNFPQPGGMVNSAHQGPVTDVPAATPQQKQIIDWMASQNDAMNQQVIADNWARAGISNPYTNPAILQMAQDAADKAARTGQAGAWEDPNWKKYLGTNKTAYDTATKVLSDPAFAQQFSAQNNLSGSNLKAWLQSALDPYGAAVQRAGTPSNLVAGPGGSASVDVSQIRRPGEAITAGEKYSRQYTGEELSGLRSLFNKYSNDPEALKLVAQNYGITPDDFGLALGMSKAQSQKFFGDAASTLTGDAAKGKALAGINDQLLNARTATDLLDTQARRKLFEDFATANGITSKVSPGRTSDENNFTPWGTDHPLSLAESHALDAKEAEFYNQYNKEHPFTPFHLAGYKDTANDTPWRNQQATDPKLMAVQDELSQIYGTVGSPEKRAEVMKNYLQSTRYSPEQLQAASNGQWSAADLALQMKGNPNFKASDLAALAAKSTLNSGIGSIVTANAGKPDVGRPDVGKPVKDVPAPSSANTPVMSAQDFATQYTSLQNNKDAKPEEWTSFLSSALANPDIKKAYGDKLMPAYQTLNTQQFSQSLLKDPYASGADLQKQIKTLMDDPAAKEKYGDKLQAIYDKAGTTQSGWYGGKQYDSLNPLAVDNIYNQLKAQQTALGTDKLMQGGALRGGDGGFGSVDAVTMDMAKNLAASGITDIKQVGQGTAYARQPVEERMMYNGQEVEKQGDKYVIPQYAVNGETGQNETIGYKEVPSDQVTKGYVLSESDGENGTVYRPLTEDEQKKLKPNAQGKMTIPVAVGQGIINKETGEKLASNYSERTQGPMWSGTFKGDGNTGYGVQFDPQTGTPVFFTRGASSANLGPLSMALGIASFIPGVAPFAMAANAALSASQGNWLGALSSGLGALGGIGNLSASTMSNLNTLKSGIGLANAVNNKDLLGALTSGSSLAGLNLGDMKLGDNFSVKDLTGGLSIANALQKGDLASLLSIGAQMSGSKDAVTAMNGLALMKAVNSGNPAAMTSAVAKLQNSQTPPPGKAAGGLLQGPAPVKVPHSMTSVDPRMFQGVAANLMARRA